MNNLLHTKSAFFVCRIGLLQRCILRRLMLRSIDVWMYLWYFLKCSLSAILPNQIRSANVQLTQKRNNRHSELVTYIADNLGCT